MPNFTRDHSKFKILKEIVDPAENPQSNPNQKSTPPQPKKPEVDQFSARDVKAKWEKEKDIKVDSSVFNQLKKAMGYMRADKGYVLLDEVQVTDEYTKQKEKLMPGQTFIIGKAPVVRIFDKEKVIAEQGNVDPGDIENTTDEREFIYADDLQIMLNNSIKNYRTKTIEVFSPKFRWRGEDLKNTTEYFIENGHGGKALEWLVGNAPTESETKTVRKMLGYTDDMEEDRTLRIATSIYKKQLELSKLTRTQKQAPDKAEAINIITDAMDEAGGKVDESYATVERIFKEIADKVVFPETFRGSAAEKSLQATKAWQRKRVLVLTEPLEVKIKTPGSRDVTNETLSPLGDEVTRATFSDPTTIQAFIEQYEKDNGKSVMDAIDSDEEVGAIFSDIIDKAAADPTIFIVETKLKMLWQFDKDALRSIVVSDKDAKIVEDHSKELPIKAGDTATSTIKKGIAKTLNGMSKIAAGAGMVGLFDLAWDKAQGKAQSWDTSNEN